MGVFDLTDLNYSKTIENTKIPIFIDFYSPMCGPCLAILPLLDKLASFYGDKILITRVDVTANPKIAQKYEINSVPFCVVIGEDKIVKYYELGAKSSEVYFRMIDKTLNQNRGFFAKIFGKS